MSQPGREGVNVATEYMECYCGARIHEVGDDYTKVWVDDRGRELCYPSESGADGEARHEPCDEWSDDD